MGKGELVALLNLYSWCLMLVEWPWGCLWFVFGVIPDHTHFFIQGKREIPFMSETRRHRLLIFGI